MKHAGTKVAAWNSHNARAKVLRRYVKRAIRKGNVAIVLTEVWTRHDELRTIARDLGLTMIAETPRPGGRKESPVSEVGDTVILLAPSFEVESHDVIVLDSRWTVFDPGPNQPPRTHAPRRLLRVVGTVGDQRIELLAVHGPTGGNKAAVAEFLSVVGRVLTTTRDDTLTIAAGDWNVSLDDAGKWAKPLGLSVSGRGPDLSATNGTTTSRKGKKRTSDHYDMSHRVTPRTTNQKERHQ